MHQIISAQPIEKYKVIVVFSDGIHGEVDLSSLVGKGVFSFLKDPKKFAEVSIDQETHTLTWPNGIDLCPDTIYEEFLSKKQHMN